MGLSGLGIQFVIRSHMFHCWLIRYQLTTILQIVHILCASVHRQYDLILANRR